jgi:hypothetical protein
MGATQKNKHMLHLVVTLKIYGQISFDYNKTVLTLKITLLVTVVVHYTNLLHGCVLWGNTKTTVHVDINLNCLGSILFCVQTRKHAERLQRPIIRILMKHVEGRTQETIELITIRTTVHLSKTMGDRRNATTLQGGSAKCHAWIKLSTQSQQWIPSTWKHRT